MVTEELFRKEVLSFPEVTEEPHFEKTSFRVGKKIIASYDAVNKRACLKLSLINQDVFSAYDKSIIYPVPNKWGQSGWTFVELSKLPKKMLKDLLTTAYTEVAPARLSSQPDQNN